MKRPLILAAIALLAIASAYARARRTDPEYHRMHVDLNGSLAE